MEQETVRFPMDEELKQNIEEICRKMGLTMADAFTMFAVKVIQDQSIPFEITAESDSFST